MSLRLLAMRQEACRTCQERLLTCCDCSYAGLRKAEIAEKLDTHLRRNATTYNKEPSLSDYYKRLGSTTRSPMKRIAEKVSDIVKSDDEPTVHASVTTAKKSRRKTRSPEDERWVDYQICYHMRMTDAQQQY